MGIVKRSLLEITRRPFRAITYMLLLVILVLGAILGDFLKESVSEFVSQIEKNNGYMISVTAKEDELIFSEELKSSILGLEEVIGYNFSSGIMECRPIDFVNVPYENNSVYMQDEPTEYVRIVANINTEYHDLFRMGKMKLIEGSFPSLDNAGVMIDERLAETNNLTVGSYLTLNYPETEADVRLCVTGIYQTNEPPKEAVEIEGYSAMAISASSYLFCDFSSYELITDYPREKHLLQFYTDALDKLAVMEEEIIAITEEAGYSVVNPIEGDKDFYQGVIYSLLESAKLILTFVYSSSFFILFFIIILWMRDHYNEIGIYIALGKSKIEVVSYLLLEILMMSIVMIGGALGIGKVFISNFGGNIVTYALDYYGTDFYNEEMKMNLISSVSSHSFMGKTGVVYLAIIVVITILAGIITVNYRVRDLLAEG